MNLYLYSNGIVDVATASKDLMNEYLSENGFPRPEALESEWDKVDVLEHSYYNDLPSEFIILEVEANKEFITNRGFKLDTKDKYRETYVKGNIELVLDWTTEMYFNATVDYDKLDYQYTQFRLPYIQCDKLDKFLEFVKEME